MARLSLRSSWGYHCLAASTNEKADALPSSGNIICSCFVIHTSPSDRTRSLGISTKLPLLSCFRLIHISREARDPKTIFVVCLTRDYCIHSPGSSSGRYAADPSALKFPDTRKPVRWGPLAGYECLCVTKLRFSTGAPTEEAGMFPI